MDSLLSYRLSDLLLFSEQTFLRQLELYNQWLFPLQPIAYLYGLICLPLFVKPFRHFTLLLFIVSGFSYPLVAYGFFWQFYAAINPLANFLIALFVLQGLILIALLPARRSTLTISDRGWAYKLGILIWLLALFAYPSIEGLSSRPLSQLSSFVLSPDSLALSSIALMLMFRLPGLWLMPAALSLLSSMLTFAALHSPSLLLPLTSLVIYTMASFHNGFGKRRRA